jgi:hypothetical protein
MTELKTTQQRYALRLTARFTYYDPNNGVHVWREWPKDKVVTDPTEIAFLESRDDAPIERIEVESDESTVWTPVLPANN